MDGYIFDIQHFCLNDGPGIRTTVFFKGCPLDCVWCHNPESKLLTPQLSFNKDLCINCEKCKDVCQLQCHEFKNNIHTINYHKCNRCGNCLDACPYNALSFYGIKVDSRYIYNQVKKDQDYYTNSNGGVTFSGGEPFLQSEFLLDCLVMLKDNNIHTCIETSGYTKKENIIKCLPYIDLFLYDFKQPDTFLYKQYTNVSSKLILDNLAFLNQKNAKIILRCPIIPTINDTQKHFSKINELVSLYNNIESIELLPYDEFGKGKAKQIGCNYKLDIQSPTEEVIESWINEFKVKGYNNIKRG